MSFRNQLLTVLRVVTPAGLTALLVRGGPNSNGQGQAVIQLSSGSADEQNPAELTAITDGDAASSSASLFIESPSKKSQGGNGRGYMQLFARTSTKPSYGIVGGDVAELVGDTIYLLGQNNPTANVQARGDVTTTGRTTTDHLTVQTGHTIPLQANEASPRANLTPAASFTVRSGYSFFVTPLGSDFAYIYGQLVAGAATSAGVLVTTVPAAFVPKTAQTIPVGNHVTSSTGYIAVCEVATDGTVKLWSGTMPAAGALLDIFGLYCLT